MKVGYYKGDTCNRNGCQGTMQRVEGTCSCHRNPPCSYCEKNEIICDECGEIFATGDAENWQNEINLKGNKMLKIINIDIKPTYEVHNGVICAEFIEHQFEIKASFNKDSVPVYKAVSSLPGIDPVYFFSLDEAKDYTGKLMLELAKDRIRSVAEILEDK